MILLDTNVVSGPLRAAPEPRLVAWLDAQPLETLFLSVITVAELRFGVARLPAGRLRNSWRDRLEARVLPAFTGRILPFDLAATQAYADLMVKAQATGSTVGLADGHRLGQRLGVGDAEHEAAPGDRHERDRSLVGIRRPAAAPRVNRALVLRAGLAQGPRDRIACAAPSLGPPPA